MPLILFMLSIFLILITYRTLKRYLIQILIFMFVISLITINSNSRLKQYYQTFYNQSEKIVSLYSYRITGLGSDLIYTNRPYYIHEFDAGISTFKLNKYIGGGVKSFRFNCPKRKIETINERTTCNMHPHNYYLEILTETGLLGFLILVSSFLLLIYKSLIKKYFLKPTNYFDNKNLVFLLKN